MIPFIVCSCGRSLGDLYDAFAALRMAKYELVFGADAQYVDPVVLAIMSDSYEHNLLDEFAALGIELECCRLRIDKQVRFCDVY